MLKRDIKERKKQAEIWLPVLQKQIELGTPKTFITLGNKANTLFKYMIKQGLNIRQEDYQPIRFIIIHTSCRSRRATVKNENPQTLKE